MTKISLNNNNKNKGFFKLHALSFLFFYFQIPKWGFIGVEPLVFMLKRKMSGLSEKK